MLNYLINKFSKKIPKKNWRVEFCEQLLRIRDLQAVTADDDEYMVPPNDIACDNAEKVFLVISDIEFEPAYVSPSTDAGICIAFKSNDDHHYCDIECFNTGEILTAQRINNGGAITIKEVIVDHQLMRRLEEALLNLQSWLAK